MRFREVVKIVLDLCFNKELLYIISPFTDNTHRVIFVKGDFYI